MKTRWERWGQGKEESRTSNTWCCLCVICIDWHLTPTRFVFCFFFKKQTKWSPSCRSKVPGVQSKVLDVTRLIYFDWCNNPFMRFICCWQNGDPVFISIICLCVHTFHFTSFILSLPASTISWLRGDNYHCLEMHHSSWYTSNRSAKDPVFIS